MTPSKSAYSTGWSSTSTARRFSAGSGEGPWGTAHDFRTPPHSRRKSKCRRRAACFCTTKRCGRFSPPRPKGSGVESAERFSLYFSRGNFYDSSVMLHLSVPKPMSARPIASGTISFGLVSIPIKIYAASDASSGISFNMLHGKDAARLKQQYICTKDGEVVPRDQMVKGYEFSKDRYVTFTPEELKALEDQSTQAIAE